MKSAGIPNDHELQAKIVLFPPGTFTAAVVNPGEIIHADEEEGNDGKDAQPQT